MAKLVNEIIEVDGTRWIVIEALSMEDALNEIAHARVTGSVGSSTDITGNNGTHVVANVHKLNADGSLTIPS